MELLIIDDPWVSRRKESVTVLDEAMMRREQSVDFTLDKIESLSEFKPICEEIFGGGVCVAPLFILEKEPASTSALDLRDESGRSLSLMTRDENTAVSAATLKVICRKKLESKGLKLENSLAERLGQLVQADRITGNAWLQRLRDPLPDDPDQEQLEVLFDGVDGNGPTEWWLATLAYASIVLVTFEADVDHRRVFTLSYDEQMSPTPPSIVTRLGWRSFRTGLFSPFVKSGRFHLEVTAPPDFRLTQAALAFNGTNHRFDTSKTRRRAHLFIDDARSIRGAIGTFGLRVSGRGILGGAFAASALVLLAVLACIKFKSNLEEEAGSAAALLLVLPGLIATYVARADQHGLATRLLAWPRWILLIFAGISAYYAAGTIALFGGNQKSSSIEWRLWPAVGMAVIAVVVTGVGWMFTRETTHLIRRWARRMVARGMSTGFSIRITLRIRKDVAWEYAIGARTPALLPAPDHVNSRVMVDSGHRYVVSRKLGRMKWTHGIEVSPAPEGSIIHWIFRTEAPRYLGLLMRIMVGVEKRAAKRRLESVRDDS